MSFTSGTLLHTESLTIAERYADLDDWDIVRSQVVADNLIRMRTANATKRISREVVSRLRLLTPAALELLLTGTRQEQLHILWLAVCKRYGFIHDFAVEVVREKFLRLDLALSYDDYDIFFQDKAEWHPEVAGVADSTRAKQRQVVFKMLREAELLTADNRIVPALLTPRTIEVVAADDPADLAIFPISPAEVQAWLP